MIEFPQDFKEFLQLANSAKIEYLVVGGYAVGYHGYPRATGDMDVWIAVKETNAKKLVQVLKEFGFDVPGLTKELFLQRNKVIRMGNPPMRLEILTDIDGVSFEDCFKNRVYQSFDDLVVPFISLGDLINNKRSTGRGKDLVDAEELERLSG